MRKGRVGETRWWGAAWRTGYGGGWGSSWVMEEAGSGPSAGGALRGTLAASRPRFEGAGLARGVRGPAGSPVSSSLQPCPFPVSFASPGARLSGPPLMDGASLLPLCLDHLCPVRARSASPGLLAGFSEHLEVGLGFKAPLIPGFSVLAHFASSYLS